MALYLKKVDAIQFILTDEEKENVRNKKTVYFNGYPVKHVGGEQYLVVFQQGENLIRINYTQWLVKHPDGTIQLVWPDQFGSNFIKGKELESIHIPVQRTKSYNQPNTII